MVLYWLYPQPESLYGSGQEQPMAATKAQRESDSNENRSTFELINTAPGVLDAPDRKIISLLQQDGRRAYGAIAEEIGLSEAAVRRRVQRLRDSGVMQIVAITEPLLLG